MKKNKLKWIGFIGGVFLTPCEATEFNYSYGAKMEYTDNVRLQTTDEVSEVTSSVLLGGELIEETSRIDSDLRMLLEHQNYRDDTFSDENWLSLSGRLNLTVRPRTFFWYIEDNFTQQEIDSLSPSTPDNIVNTNVFTTGPDLIFRINPANSLNVGSRITDFSYDETETDNERLSIDVSWVLRLTYLSEFSMNLSHQDVNYNELDDSDFNKQNLYARLSTQYSRSFFEVDAGISSVRSKYFEDVDGFLAKLLWRNQFRDQSYFQVDLSSQYTDSGQDLLSHAPLDLGEAQVSGDVFYDKRAEVAYYLSQYSHAYTMLIHYREEDYETVSQDREISGARLSYVYTMSPNVSFNSQVETRTYDNIDIDRKDERLTALLACNYRMSRDYTMQLQYDYLDQESNVEVANYDENKVMLTLFYGRNPNSYR